MKLAQQKVSKYYAEVTPTTCMIRMSGHILDPFPKLRSFRKWDKGMAINPEGKASCTTQYQEAFPKYVENEYCAKHRHVPVNTLKSLPSSKLIPSGTASGLCQLSIDSYDLFSDDEEYLTPNNVAEMTPRQSDCAARLLTAARLYSHLLSESSNNWGQIHPNLNDSHSDQMEISSTFWIQDITNWWRQQEEVHSKDTDLSNVAHDIVFIIPHGFGVKASFSPD